MLLGKSELVSQNELALQNVTEFFCYCPEGGQASDTHPRLTSEPISSRRYLCASFLLMHTQIKERQYLSSCLDQGMETI